MAEKNKTNGFSGLQVFGITILIMALTVAGTLYAVKIWFFPAPFQPVVLSQSETSSLNDKLLRFEIPTQLSNHSEITHDPANGRLKPETYSEVGATRTIIFSEREINALLAKNTELADKLAIDLSDELISAKLLLPVDPDFPVMGGKTIRVKAGVQFSYLDSHPVIKIKGVSVMGIPVPAAWLGGLKNLDLIEEYGSSDGFWKTFSAGVNSITITDGQLHIQLNE